MQNKTSNDTSWKYVSFTTCRFRLITNCHDHRIRVTPGDPDIKVVSLLTRPS